MAFRLATVVGHFGDNRSLGSFRVQPPWVTRVSGPAVHRLGSDLGVGRSRGVSIWRTRGRLRSNAQGSTFRANLATIHCTEPPAWTCRWRSPKGDAWFLVWACPDHLEGLTGLREFGRRWN